MAAEFSHVDVRKVALLARLKLSDAEAEHFASQLGDVLGYIKLLEEVNTEEIDPMVHAIELSNVFRRDEVRPSLPRDAALANAPKTDGRFFLVPQIIDSGS
jgi:aspartyl-tRNA(Asn)/glutamyl-tRNA(Gln) amidotransferase subunit C